jgi:predicted lipoprotein with Yx(FWY)xxD motif
MSATRTPTSRVLRLLGIACCATLAVAVYAAGTDAAFATSKPTVKIASVSGVGSVLVASNGRTLYTLTKNGEPVACTGACAAEWPPLTVKSGAEPRGAKGVTGLGTTSGGNQVTDDGLPLYRFSGDTKSGVAGGEGITDFGGTWHVVKVAKPGSATRDTPTRPAAPANSSPSSSSGYGY